MYKPVLTKRDFVRRYKAGEFGNASPTWNTLKEFLHDHLISVCHYLDYKFKEGNVYHFRNRVAGGKTYYNQTGQEIINLWNGVDRPGDYYCSEMAPHHKGTIQGELGYVAGDLCLTYNTQQLPMRDGFAVETKHKQGILAWLLLQDYMCHNSFYWLKHLLCEYPGHVIEFSCFSTNWGTLPHYNTVFWEVRSY